MSSLAIVVTTILKQPNDCLRALARNLFLVGDEGSPAKFDLADSQWYPLERQAAEFGRLAKLIPTRHYARKNIGYLAAMASGADAIHDIDDDNVPRENFWDVSLPAEIESAAAPPWFNIYSLFTGDFVWPRGFPLEFIQHQKPPAIARRETKGRIIQFLAAGDPDVDAIFRLTRPQNVVFRERPPVELAAGTWCPFNSQNTRFTKDVFPLLYLPSHCSFRMTDIWRSFVAQRCLWELGEGIIFHSATVDQLRNEHNLLKDFAQEVDGYLNNDAIRKTLEALRLDPRDMYGNLIKCYESLSAGGFFKGDEMPIVRSWCEALQQRR